MAFTKGQLELLKSIFPYDPYPPQTEYMKDVFSIIENNKIGLLEAPSGFGKTSALLTAALSGFPYQTYYYSRTHAQMKQVAQELDRINKKSGNSFSCVVRGSRNQLCLDNDLKKIRDYRVIAEICYSRIKYTRSNKDFFEEFYSKAENTLGENEELFLGKNLYCDSKFGKINIPATIPDNVPLIADIESLKKFCLKNKICPYFLARLLAQSFDVVVGSYKYLFYDNFYQDQIMVLDEAHNIEQLCKEGVSFSLSQSTVNQALDELNEIESSWASELQDFLVNLLMFFKHTEFKDGELLSSSQFLTELDKFGVYLEHLRSFLDDWQIIHNCWNELKKIRKKFILLENLRIVWVYRFLYNFVYSAEESYRGIWSLRGKKNPTIAWFCLDSRVAFDQIRARTPKAIILTSGTLSPQERIANRLGVEEPFAKSYPAIFPEENIQILVLTKGPNGNTLTTSYRERGNQEIIIDYGRTVVKIINNIPNGSVVFFPSYYLMDNMLGLWNKREILNDLNAEIFIESRDSGFNILDLYSEEASKKRTALFAVIRGKLSEGQNFPDEIGRAVIIVGIPYPNVQDPKLQAQREYYERKKKGMGSNWYYDETFNAVNQAIGRAWRHKDDYAMGFLLDYRYRSNLNKLPFWSTKKTSLIEPYTPYSTIEKIIQNFFKARV
ncbi:MAG: hypothetical protein HWN67_14325 [Candidatus Helarchaeota archaeon]|nr:hypothetical protein [Candidatus Helarchaeota archaeon]